MHGIYGFPDAWVDAMYVLNLRCEQAVFLHETALFLHELTDRGTMQYEITVKNKYSPTNLKADAQILMRII